MENIIEYSALIEDPVTGKTYKLVAESEEELNKKVNSFMEKEFGASEE